MKLDYSGLPEDLQGGMRRYIEQGIEPGSFLEAVLTNDLFGAFGRADLINRHRLYDICRWVYKEAPYSCWGSKERFEAWITKGGAGRGGYDEV